MISVNRRFMPFLNRARSWINEVGPIHYARATQVRHLRTEAEFIWSTSIHVLDAVRYVVGDIKHFEVDRQPVESVTWYVISLLFESGALGRIEILPTAGMVEESYEFFGQDFRTRVTGGSGTQRSLECWQAGKLVVEAQALDKEPEDLRNGAYLEVEEFVRALRTGTRAYPEVDDILPSARICFSIADSFNKEYRPRVAS